jgi:hypothetical protein
MTIKELFEGPVGDYCIARNTIKCLFIVAFLTYLEDALASSVWEKLLLKLFYLRSKKANVNSDFREI